ncbi:MAG: non-ribosomal peptide synthetase, partial [bacterium]|nr:non-ribosomal peptide synthetase [bacterium]
AEKKEYYPLSSAQKRMYLLTRMAPEGTGYNMPYVMKLEERIETSQLEEAVRQLIKRHESFRTTFFIKGEEAVQQVHPEVAFTIRRWRVREPGPEGPPLNLEEILQDFLSPFDLTKAPLLRVGVVSAGDRTHYLLTDMHHIISDGRSNEIMHREVQALFNRCPLLPLPLQYKDFAQWQNSPQQKEQLLQQEAYWQEEFKDKVPLLEMPLDFERPLEIFPEAGVIRITLEKTLTEKINATATRSEATPMMMMLAAYKILLAKYTGLEDIVVGTVIAGRRHTDLEQIIGFFVNMLPIRTQPKGEKSFAGYLAEVREKAVNAFENQDYPFEEMVNTLNIPRQAGRHPLVDTVFVFHREEGNTVQETTETEETLKVLQVSHFDLMLHATAAGDVFDVYIEYSKALFKEATIEYFTKYYREIVEQVIENQEIRLDDVKTAHNLLTAKSPDIQEDDEDWF